MSTHTGHTASRSGKPLTETAIELHIKTFMIRFVTVIMAGLVAASANADEQGRLAGCLDQVNADPATGYDLALAWLSQGGRPAAQHCTAMALSALGHHAEAAARLETLANAPNAGRMSQRAEYLALAGNLWILARRPDEAVITLTSALKLSRGDSGLLTDRARAHLMKEDWSAAIDDLERVLAGDRNNVEALHLRGRARARTGNFEEALNDIQSALDRDPENMELLVLRGEIRSRVRAR